MKYNEIWIASDYGGHRLFEGGRHCISLGLIDETEKAICDPDEWVPEIKP